MIQLVFPGSGAVTAASSARAVDASARLTRAAGKTRRTVDDFEFISMGWSDGESRRWIGFRRRGMTVEHSLCLDHEFFS